MSEQLRRAIDASEHSHYAICQACDIDKGSMSRFMSGKVGLSLAALDRIVAFLDLELVERGKAGKR